MGEFSAGKSTLANLMMETNPLPVQAIATRLPPVRMSYGSGRPYRLAMDGIKHEVDLSDLREISLKDTELIQIFRQEQTLELCEIIDMPGISDPNIDASSWQRVLPQADAIIWCTHATQAWRQSEATAWEQVPIETRSRSILLITRIDKIAVGQDRIRVIQRVQHEAGSHFASCLPISLTDAHAAGDDVAKWKESGAMEFANRFLRLVEDISAQTNKNAHDTVTQMPTNPMPEQNPRERVVPRRVVPHVRKH